MKVYELIAELSKLPAGADVEFATVLTSAELLHLPEVDTDDTESAYRVSDIVKESELINDTLVCLYL